MNDNKDDCSPLSPDDPLIEKSAKKDAMKNYLILGLLVVAVCGVIAMKSLQTHQAVAGMADDTVIGKGKPVLLELGSHSCIPCKKMMPILEELSTEQSAFMVSFVDVWAVEGKSEQYGIQSIPTQIFFDKDGAELFRHVGFYPKEDILAKWKELGI
ncbi:MAG: thioredoxin family protein [Planctomycetota bacterium]|jgi:thioredoxin 1